MARGPAMMLYELLDRQVDNYIPLIDKFEERLEQLGDDIFHVKRQEREMLNELLTAKSSALRLGRMLAPQRELVSRLSVGEYPVVPQTVRIYYRDVYDHMARLTNLAESMRDLATSTIETHLALVNNRMNEVMKVLTMISTIFIPLSHGRLLHTSRGSAVQGGDASGRRPALGSRRAPAVAARHFTSTRSILRMAVGRLFDRTGVARALCPYPCR
jgi:hypothetical protein